MISLPTENDPAMARRPLILGCVAVVLVVFGFGGWAVLARIAGAVIAPATIEVAGQHPAIQHPDGGVVETVLVSEGDAVAAGDPILTLDGTFLRSDLAAVEGQFFELLARRARLEAERDGQGQVVFPADLLGRAVLDPAIRALLAGQRRLFEARAGTLSGQQAQLGDRIAQIGRQIAGIDAQLAALDEQSRLLAAELQARQGLLDKGLALAPDVLALRRQMAQLAGQIGALTAARAEAGARIAELRQERLTLRAARHEAAAAELRDIAPRLADLAERRRGLRERIDRLVLRAPVAGVVHGLHVSAPRAVLRPAEPVATLVPLNQPLVVMARVGPADAHRLRPGQQARLRLAARADRLGAELTGRLGRLSADVFRDERTGQAFYLAELTPDLPATVSGAGVDLRPGMPVEVLILTPARAPLEYLLRPLADHFATALRED